MQTRLRGCNPSRKSQFSIWELCVKDQHRNSFMVSCGTEGSGAEPDSTEGLGARPPRCNGFAGRSIPDADGSEELQTLREIQVFDLGVVCKKSKQTRPYGTMWHRRLIQLPELTTWISLGSCSSPDLVASWEKLRPQRPCTLGGYPPQAPRTLVASLSNHCTWRLRPQNSAVASLFDCNSKGESLESSSKATARVRHRSLQVQRFECAAPEMQRVW